MQWVGWLISAVAILLGIAQAVIVLLVNKSNRQQEARFQDIQKQLGILGKFKDDVLASYPTRSEIKDHRTECGDKFSNVFDRLRDLEKGGGLQ